MLMSLNSAKLNKCLFKHWKQGLVWRKIELVKMREPKYLGVPIYSRQKGQNSWSKDEKKAPSIYEKYELDMLLNETYTCPASTDSVVEH